MKHGKKYVESAKLVDRTKLYEPAEALETVVKTASAKFDEAIFEAGGNDAVFFINVIDNR